MTEFMQIIAEAEGMRTPTKKRSKAEVETAFKDFTETRAKKKAAVKAKTPKKAQPVKTAPVKKEVTAVPVITIKREKVTTNPGNITSGGFDKKSGMLHIEFGPGNVYEFPNTTEQEWKDLRATFVNAEVDTGAYFRKAFRGRAAGSRKIVDPMSTGVGKPAPAKNADGGKA